MSAKDKTDLSLALAAFAAMASLLAPTAAAIVATVLFGLPLGWRHPAAGAHTPMPLRAPTPRCRSGHPRHARLAPPST